MNRLANATSTYLLQHKDNPVDWWEWSDAAFAEAVRRNVPVLLSVGYASCHWCHVMAHESFEDHGIAELINQNFVPIKVDREERPDIDAIYMSATQALTGQGGWPMTCFLTPSGEPFYAGTYFPPQPRSGMPAFSQVLAAIVRTWAEDPGEVRAAAGRITEALQKNLDRIPPATVDADQLNSVRDSLVSQIDRQHGGFGTAPKFPPAMVAEFLLRNYERTGSVEALDAVTLTLEKMARGGIYDQLAGGFARYSVDAAWHIPHFEKMLDDNALLLRVYAHHARLTGSPLTRRIAEETGDFLIRELRTDGGMFAASLDADTAGVEGLTYRWSPAELASALNADGGARGHRDHGHANAGDGEGGGQQESALNEIRGSGETDSVLRLFGINADDLDPAGQVLRLPEGPADARWFASVRARLMAVRNRRPQPGRDDIVVLRSNGLAIVALAEAGAALDRPEWVDAAERAVDAVLAVHRDGAGWRRSSLGGAVGPGPATLADDASLAAGLLALYQVTGAVGRLTLAVEILDRMLERFRAPGDGWFDTAAPESDGPVIVRPRDPTDGAAPSGASSAADALLTASALTGSARLREAAEQSTAAVGSLALRFPRSAGWHLAVAEALAAGPLQIAIAGPAGDRRTALASAARRHAPGGSVIEIGDGDSPGRPLLADRHGVDGDAAAYVCRGFVCDAPVATASQLQSALRG